MYKLLPILNKIVHSVIRGCLEHIMHLKNDYNSLLDLARHMNTSALTFALHIMGDRPEHANFYKTFFENLLMDETYLDNPDDVNFCIKMYNENDLEVIYNLKNESVNCQ